MNIELISETRLFKNINIDDIPTLLTTLSSYEKSYEKGTEIYHTGDSGKPLALLLNGTVQIENIDFWGNKSVLDSLSKGQVFAETYSLVQDEPMMVSVVATSKCSILFLNTANLLNLTDPSTSELKFLQNLLLISVNKNLHLSQRIFHTSSKTIRGRLISYLSAQAARFNSQEFEIPFDRQQLADYLNVDRSALSGELSKMKADGLIDYRKNKFMLLEDL